MVKTDIKLSPSKPFVWYQEYHYYGMDPENFHTHPTWQLTIVTEGELCFTFAGGDRRPRIEVRAGRVCFPEVG